MTQITPIESDFSRSTDRSGGSSGKMKNNSSQNLPEVKAIYEDSMKRKYSLDNIPRDRPYVNSVLHLFGKWLFEAALGTEFEKTF